MNRMNDQLQHLSDFALSPGEDFAREPATLADILGHFQDEVRAVPEPLPRQAENFMKGFKRAFSVTAEQLRERARELRLAADDCMERALQLDQASPEVLHQLETWIRFEREAFARQASLSLVKVKTHEED